MNRIFGLFAAFALCLTVVSTPVRAASPSWQILDDGGVYHGDQVKPDLRSTWYGVFLTNDGYVLKKVRMKIRIEKDGVVDEGTRKTGKRVVVEPAQDYLFLVGTDQNLTEGPLSGLTPSAEFLEINRPLDFSILNRDYRLTAEGNPVFEAGNAWWRKNKTYVPYRMVLSEKGKSQILSVTESLFRGGYLSGPGGFPFVVWCGDLDRDGHLDLLLNEASENAQHWVLFLSSEAGPTELVGKAAEWMATGC